MINPKWLTTYMTLVEEGHFTRTANKLFMTQPGVSQHISKLEEACETPLIIRQGKTFELTPAGFKLYEYAKQQQALHQTLIESIRFDDPNSGVAKIACSGALTQQLYPLCLQIQTHYPGLQFTFESCSNQGAMDRVLNGKSDVALMTQQATHPLLDQQHIGEQQLSMVLPASTNNHDVNAEYLKQLGIVSHPDALHYLSLYRHSPQRNLLSELDLSDVEPVSYVNQLEQILAPVSMGIGFTVLPNSCVALSPYRQQLRVLKDHSPVMESVVMVTKSSKALPLFYNHFIELCRNTLNVQKGHAQR
jgi:DNA-binding transcriptional LysR family regulator